MNRRCVACWPILFLTLVFANLAVSESLFAQAGMREALLRLDKDKDGKIKPHEITPLARAYLERITRARRMSLDKENDIDRLLDAARIYYALRNGVSGRDIRPGGKKTVIPFGPKPDEPLIPEFGVPFLKFRYIKADLDEAARTMRNYDANRDGFIDVFEAARNRWTHRDPFQMDFNKDGRLSRMELAQRYARRRILEGSSQEVWRKARRIGGLLPKSRRVYSENEEQREARRRRNSRSRGQTSRLAHGLMSRFDSNRNGRLEATETRRLRLPLQQIDSNKNGELSRDELQNYLSRSQVGLAENATTLPDWFAQLDANQDRQVTMSEFTTKWTKEKLDQFTSLDRNDDGLLTMAEVTARQPKATGGYFNRTAKVLPPRKTIISEIEVRDDFRIGDLNVQLSITHSHDRFLDAFLIGPGGQRIELFTEVGGTDDNFDQTMFDDQSPRRITKSRPPFRGSYMPEGKERGQRGLSYFNGKSVKGVWRLEVRATRSERFGILHDWGLFAKPQKDTKAAGGKPSPKR